MATKSTAKQKEVGLYMCSNCSTEFSGKACPECGNSTNNMKLAADGIPQMMHQKENAFGDLESLRELNDTDFDDTEMIRMHSKMQDAELKDNLRESLVYKSKAKKLDIEKDLLKKQMEIDLLKKSIEAKDYSKYEQESRQVAPQPQYDQSMFQTMMSPQALFMKRFMDMDEEKRSSLLEDLSNADPMAIQTLAGLSSPQQNYNQMYSPMMNPWMMNPWMMQNMMGHQQQQQQEQADPYQIALLMMGQMMDLSEKLNPKHDDGIKDYLRELKDEIKKTNERVDASLSKERTSSLDPIIDKLKSLESRLESGPQKQESIADKVSEITTLVSGLEQMGLVKRQSTADTTVDDEIKLRKLEHEISKDNMMMKLEADRNDSEKQKQQMSQKLVGALFQRGMKKSTTSEYPPTPTPPKNTITGRQYTNRAIPPPINSSNRPIETHEAEAGTVHETLSPAKKE